MRLLKLLAYTALAVVIIMLILGGLLNLGG